MKEAKAGRVTKIVDQLPTGLVLLICQIVLKIYMMQLGMLVQIQ